MVVAVVIICIFLLIKSLSYDRATNQILVVGLGLRVFIYVADINHWFYILGSGVDTEAFDYYATTIALTGYGLELTHYTTFLAVIYSLTDCSRLFAQAINLLFGMGVLFCAVSTLKYLNVSDDRKNKALWILAILPNLVIFSGVLLREAWIEFFVALSVLEFTKWYVTGSKLRMLTTIIYVCCGIYMHDGVIALLVGYIIAFAIYDPNKKSIHISFSQVCVIAIFIVVFIVFSDSFMGEKSSELTENDSVSLILKYSNQDATGNSGYLEWLPKTENPIIGILFAPLKMLYFMFAPLPTEWRRASDIIGFLIDSIFYIGMWYAICNKRTAKLLESYKRCLLIAVLSATFMFAYGTLNAGTAFRHRAKFCEPIAILYAISTYPKNRKYRITQ